MVAERRVGHVVLLQEPHGPRQHDVNEDEVDPQEGVTHTHIRDGSPDESVVVLKRAFAPVVSISHGREVDWQKDAAREHAYWQEELNAQHQEPRVHEGVQSCGRQQSLVGHLQDRGDPAENLHNASLGQLRGLHRSRRGCQPRPVDFDAGPQHPKRQEGRHPKHGVHDCGHANVRRRNRFIAPTQALKQAAVVDVERVVHAGCYVPDELPEVVLGRLLLGSLVFHGALAGVVRRRSCVGRHVGAHFAWQSAALGSRRVPNQRPRFRGVATNLVRKRRRFSLLLTNHGGRQKRRDDEHEKHKNEERAPASSPRSPSPRPHLVERTPARLPLSV
mmetsp:Transcript_9472/g.26932  ORF Transcript_9472/g.26932 Transcript_9472/m.26932 type:complete len:332 (+) Transcript_9472:3368-4363(+)